MLHSRLEHRFVKHIPDSLDNGVFYISMEYATAAHRCCCGCGEEVVTPFSPTDWKLTFDGETVSLWPSIGNWTLPCRSHYVIDRSRAIDGDFWNARRITKNAQPIYPALPTIDTSALESEESTSESTSPSAPAPASVSFWQKLLRFASRRSE
jgi:hypothetical protein